MKIIVLKLKKIQKTRSATRNSAFSHINNLQRLMLQVLTWLVKQFTISKNWLRLLRASKANNLKLKLLINSVCCTIWKAKISTQRSLCNSYKNTLTCLDKKTTQNQWRTKRKLMQLVLTLELWMQTRRWIHTSLWFFQISKALLIGKFAETQSTSNEWMQPIKNFKIQNTYIINMV